MDDDLDTPGALATMFELVRRANASADAGDAGGALRTARTVALLCSALGLTLQAGSGESIDEVSAELVRRRDEARAERDWSRADGLRQDLEQAGWLVEDGPAGTRIRRR